MQYFRLIAKADHKLLPTFLLALAVVLGLFIAYYHFSNEKLLKDYEVLQNYSQLYVVPGASAGYYDPSEPEVLLQRQAFYLMQMMNSYTPETFLDQYEAVRKFLTPEFKVKADAYFAQKRISVIEDEQSTKLVIDEESYTSKPLANVRHAYEVEVEGSMQYIMAGKIVQAVPIKFYMVFKRRYITEHNPYGFVLDEYRSKRL